MSIKPHELYSINFYEYGEAYFGSCDGTRYRVAIDPLKNVHFTPPEKRDPAVLKATVWPEPYSYGATDKNLMTSENFEISQEGFEAAVAWINEQYESRISEWTK